MTDFELNDRKRLIRSLEMTGLVWVVLAVILALVPLARVHEDKRVFPSIAIELVSPEPLRQDQAITGEKSEAPDAKAAARTERKAAKKAAAAAKVAEAAKQKSATPKQKSDLGIPDFAPQKVPESGIRDTGEYLDFGSSAQTATEGRTASSAASATLPELEGSAANVQKPSAQGGLSASAATRAQSGALSTGASAETSRSLEAIAGESSSAKGVSASDSTTATATAPGVNQASVPAGSTSADSGKSASVISGMTFDGSPRKLLYPAVPAIALPESLSRLIDSNRSVTVGFTVRSDGSVPAGLVTFSPSALLPAEIRDYLRAEFSRWRFEQSALDGQARFLYSIRVQ